MRWPVRLGRLIRLRRLRLLGPVGLRPNALLLVASFAHVHLLCELNRRRSPPTDDETKSDPAEPP